MKRIDVGMCGTIISAKTLEHLLRLKEEDRLLFVKNERVPYLYLRAVEYCKTLEKEEKPKFLQDLACNEKCLFLHQWTGGRWVSHGIYFIPPKEDTP